MHSQNGVCWIYHGVVSLEEICCADEAMFNDPRFDKLDFFIVDATNVSRFSFTPRDVDKLAAMDGVGSSYKTN